MTPHYSLGCMGGFKPCPRDNRPPRQRVRSSRLTVDVFGTVILDAHAWMAVTRNLR